LVDIDGQVFCSLPDFKVLEVSHGYGSRFTVHGSRFAVCGSWFEVCGLRF
jgi:hypothetical protein